MPKNLKLNVLSSEEINCVHQATLDLLSTIGVKVEGAKAMALLAEAGCKRNSNGNFTFKADLLEYALKKAPREIKLYNTAGTELINLKYLERQYFGTHADQLEILDPATGKYRRFLRDDIQLMCRLTNTLNNLDFILSVGMADDVHPAIQSQVTFMDTVKYFNKVINFSTNDLQGLKDIIEIASTVTGGLNALQEKPFLFFYCEPIPPLTHPEASTEKLCLAAENKIPVVYMPYCMMGGTAPMSLSGTLVQCNAEVLSGLVIAQLTREDGAPFIYGAMPSVFDMKTTIGSYGAPEFHLLVAASAMMAAYYKLPFYGTAGCTDARPLDEQAVAETVLELFSTILSEAHLVHDLGVMDHCNSISPELVVLADELINTVKGYTRGLDFSDLPESLAVMAEVGPGRHFLEEEHTLNNFRQIWYPQLFSRAMRNSNDSEVRVKIRQRILEAMQNPAETITDRRLISELDRYERTLKCRF